MHIEKTRFEGKARRGISPGTIYKTIWLLASLPRRLPTCHTMHHLPSAAASPPITLTAGQIFLREIVGIGSDLIDIISDARGRAIPTRMRRIYGRIGSGSPLSSYGALLVP